MKSTTGRLNFCVKIDPKSGMLESNYRGDDAGCYAAWDDGNFVKPWVSDAREHENAKAAALVAETRAQYEDAAFASTDDDATAARAYAADDDADIADTIGALDALIAAGGTRR